MSKARDLANAGTALTTVSATELGYLDGVTSAVQTQIDSKEPNLPSQTGNSGKYLTTNGSAKSWGTVSQYALPSQTGNAGKFLTTNGTSESWGSVGTNWKYYFPAVNATNFDYGVPTFIGKVNGYWFILTGNGFIMYSSDAKSWTRWASTVTENNISLYGVLFGNSTYVFLGSSGNLYSATTFGGTLTSRTSQFAGDDIYDGVWMGGSVNLFIIVGGNGYVSTSPDGVTWTARTSNQPTRVIYSIAVNDTNTLAILVSNGSVANKGSYSSNGTTWTAFSPDNGSSAGTNSEIFYDAGNAKWIYVKYAQEWYESTSPTSGTWTTRVAMPITYGTNNTSQYALNGTSFIAKDATNNKWIVISNISLGWFNIYTIDPTSSTTGHASRKIYKIDSIEQVYMPNSQNVSGYTTMLSSGIAYDSGIYVGAPASVQTIISNA